jgi:thioredoxin 2
MNQTDTVIVRCPACGAGNRIPAERIGQPAKCGKCHRALPSAKQADGSGALLKIRCVQCGAKNRVPIERLNAGAKCGKCKAQLQTEELFTSQPLTVTEASFDSKVLKSPLPVLMFAWAPWCATCAAVAPIIDEFAAASKGKVRVAKVNIDGNPNLASKFNIMSVPFLFIFDGGQLKESIPGALQKHELMMKMAPYL